MAWCEVCEYENLGLSELHAPKKQNLNPTATELNRETKMNKFYIGKCSKGLVVFMAVADTPLEQADCAKDIKNLIKKGFNVELVGADPTAPAPEWCYETRCQRCLR